MVHRMGRCRSRYFSCGFLLAAAIAGVCLSGCGPQACVEIAKPTLLVPEADPALRAHAPAPWKPIVVPPGRYPYYYAVYGEAFVAFRMEYQGRVGYVEYHPLVTDSCKQNTGR